MAFLFRCLAIGASAAFVACGASADPEPSPAPVSAEPPPREEAAPAAPAEKGACTAPVASSRIAIPKDEARHGDFFEWWYWTGHLSTPTGRPFGFQLTFFESTPRTGIPLATGTMAHFAVSDVKAGTFHHDYRFAPASAYPQRSDGFRVSNETWWAEGGAGAYTMHAESDGYVLDLALTDDKRPVFHFGSGFTPYPEPYAGYTYYDSRPRLRAKGTLAVDGAKQPVDGEVWMDQQWGQPPQTPQPFPFPPIVETAYAWSWFQFQLESGEELMVVQMTMKGAPFLVGGTFVKKDCAYESLDAKAFTLTPLRSWTSPHTGVVYPQDWRVEVPSKGLRLEAKAVLADQELYKHAQASPLGLVAPAYWEGKVDVTGTGPAGAVRGKGYAEVVGRR